MRTLTLVPRVYSHFLLSACLKSAVCNGSLLPRCSYVQLAKQERASLFRIKDRCFSSSIVVETFMDYERDQHLDDKKVVEKDTTLQHALSQLLVDFDRESNLTMCRFFSARRAPVIPTGSLKLDQSLGIGGLPKGRMVEIYGREASGKTTLALHIVKEAQKLGGCCAYLDVENAIDFALAEEIGVKTENLLFARPNSAENTLSIVNTLVNSGSVDVIVVDSVAALVPECEVHGLIGIESCDMQSRLMTQALRKIHQSLSRSQALLLFVNQIRQKGKSSIDSGGGNEFTCGGNALKFYSAVRLRITRNELLRSQDKITGISVSVQVTKNKMAPAMKKADLEIEFGKGFRREAEIFVMALDHGIITREGNGYWIEGKFIEGRKEAEAHLAENVGVADELANCLRNQLFRIEEQNQ
ncbi:DNA repair protein recA like 2, mitochondrial [Apostasia shenzhenica]|uniref:DNA repair protein recA like 2, mitochondrial n=1 Tax=Apostasia shenzhenica TaxID=1088818 RepID=A0A2I0B1U0_9ASPA|nr:DNA repair protein recA like 2, mitochondrial [Apostasia shenzhenica]